MQDVELSYGSKHARNRLENLKISTAGQDNLKISPPNKSADSATKLTSSSSTSGIANQPNGSGGDVKSAATDNTTANTITNNTTASIANTNTTTKATTAAATPVSTPLQPVDNPLPLSVPIHVSEATEEEEIQQRKIALAGARTAAIEKASVGGAILTIAVLIRRLVFKI